MKTSLLFRSAFVGLTMLWAAPALAQDEPAGSQPPARAETTVVVQPAQQPAQTAAPSTVVVNQPDRASDSPRSYPGLTWGGVALWGVSYSVAAIGAAVANDACTANNKLCVQGREVLYIPLAGPFIALGGVRGTGSSTLQAMLAINGAFQIGGVAMALTGVILSANAAAAPRHVAAAALRPVAKREFMIAPIASPTTAGIGAIGRF